MNVSPPSRVIAKTSIFKQIRKIFNPMAINVQRISLTHDKFYFLHYSVREVIYALIDVLGHFQSFCNHEFFGNLNLPVLVALVGQREKSQKYFDLSAINKNLNDSNP